MTKGLYCVWDTIRREMNAPFMANNDEHAQRIHQHGLSEVPADYQAELELYFLCYVDITSMYLTVDGAPRLVPNAIVRVLERTA